MPPSFSVVVTTVFRPVLLDQALQSIRQQTLPAAEVIVVIDDPEDRHGEVARIRARHPGVRVVLGEGRGEGLARHVGHRAATGEWVCFLDDDDLWSRHKLALQAEHIAGHEGCQATRGTFWIFAEAQDGPDGMYGFQRDVVATDLDQLEQHAAAHPPRNDFRYLDIRGRSLELMLERNRGVISTSAVRREVLADLPRPPADLVAGADWILMTEVAARTEWCLQREGMAFYRLHTGQVTHSPRVPVDTVRAMRTLWTSLGDSAPRPLADYSQIYRRRIQDLAWSAARGGQWASAARVVVDGWALLPRVSDRACTLVPLPVVYRASRVRGALQRRMARWFS